MAIQPVTRRCFFFLVAFILCSGAVLEQVVVDQALVTVSGNLESRGINFTSSKTLVGRCRDRPKRALLLTCPNVKNLEKQNKKENEKKRKQKQKKTRINNKKRNAS